MAHRRGTPPNAEMHKEYAAVVWTKCPTCSTTSCTTVNTPKKLNSSPDKNEWTDHQPPPHHRVRKTIVWLSNIALLMLLPPTNAAIVLASWVVQSHPPNQTMLLKPQNRFNFKPTMSNSLLLLRVGPKIPDTRCSWILRDRCMHVDVIVGNNSGWAALKRVL